MSSKRALRLCARTGLPPCELLTRGVGHEAKSLSDVRRPDARSAEIECCEGVVRSFHVSLNKVEPRESKRARNLLSKDDARAALPDEREPDGPQVTLACEARAFSCGAEILTRTGAGPDGSIVRPSCEAEGERPAADAGEEVALGVAGEIGRLNIDN